MHKSFCGRWINKITKKDIDLPNKILDCFICTMCSERWIDLERNKRQTLMGFWNES